MPRKAKATTTRKKEGAPPAKAAGEKEQKKKKAPRKNTQKEVQTVIATVAEMPVPAEIPAPIEKHVQAEGIDRDVLTSDEQDKEMLAILGAKTDEDAQVSIGNLARYLEFLNREMDLPILVTGSKPFGWEKPFVWQIRDSGKYEELKAKNPSYTDKFEVIALDSDFDEIAGIVAQVVRSSDKQEFLLPLAELQAVEEESKNSRLLKEYSSWFEEYRE